MYPHHQPMSLTTTSVINAVSQVFPVTPSDLTGRRRRRNETDARHCAMYLIHRLFRMSNRQVADLFGRHGSSSVCNSRRRYDALVATDPQYRAMVGKVGQLLGISIS